MMTTGRMQTVIDMVRNQKEFLSVIAAIVVGVIGSLSWATANFVTVARGETMMEKTQAADVEIMRQTAERDAALSKQITALTEQVVESNDIMLTHIDRYTLDSVKSEIRTNQSETFQLQQFIRVNGSDNQSEIRKQQLKTDLEELQLKKSCIINHNPLCD